MSGQPDDGLGSTRALTDETGIITDTYDYSAYGELIDSTGNTENSYRYTGEQYDSSLGNYYLRARYYDPSAGRFTQMDTFQGWMDDPITLHKYAYGNMDPVNHTDPSGYFSLGSLSAGMNIAGVLARAAISRVGLSVANFIVDDDVNAKATSSRLGATIIFGMLGPKSGKTFVNLLSSKKCDNSFSNGTLVHTEEGLKPIENIQIGDKVLSFNDDSGENEYQPVIHLVHTEKEYTKYVIELESGEKINTTSDHKFHVLGESWVDAKNLEIGSLLSTEQGLVSVVGKTAVVENGFVYNLSVDVNHNFYGNYSPPSTLPANAI